MAVVYNDPIQIRIPIAITYSINVYSELVSLGGNRRFKRNIIGEVRGATTFASPDRQSTFNGSQGSGLEDNRLARGKACEIIKRRVIRNLGDFEGIIEYDS